MPRQYTDAEKMAYYKAKAEGRKAPANNRYKAARKAKPKYSKNYRPAPAARVRGPSKSSALGASLGTMAGTALGGAPGALIGNFLGGKLGHLVGEITGFGDYKIQKNSILTGGVSPPEVVNSINTGGIIVRHREYIGDILSTTNFTVQSFLIQPGLPQTFPWLSQIANSYEQYKLRGMLFEYNATSSDSILSAATSTALGSVIMMTDYDIADPLPTDKRQMLNAEFSCSSKPSDSFIHPIECAKSMSPQNQLYTRNTIQMPTGFDQRLYDFARFHIATSGMQVNGGVIGELWVTYEIELLKQQLYFPGLTDHFGLSGPSAAAPLSTNVRASSLVGGTLGGSISANGLQYQFSQSLVGGLYLVLYSMSGTTGVPIQAPAVTYTNCVNQQWWNFAAFPQFSAPTNSATSSQYMFATIVRVTAQSAILTFGTAGALPTGSTLGDLWVTRLADSIIA